MRELPDVAALAEAGEERVLKLWEGLGYYSRARNLQRAATRIAARPGGRFPEIPAEILELAGIGRYTAGAIASIAFDQPEPILDGNVIRVLTRVLALPGDPKSKPVNEQLWSAAAALVRTAAEATASGSRRCARFNQALMELGATVCTPSTPKCRGCPWTDACSARRLGQTDRFPQTIARPVVTARYFATAVLRHRQRHLVRRRNEDAVNAGFWEFPNVEIAQDDEPAPLIARWLGLSGVEWSRLPDLRHAITRYRITQRVVAATAEPDLRRVPGEWRWVTRRELDALALTGAHRRIARSLEDAG
jgi:A/G-specific adenine glycosylase